MSEQSSADRHPLPLGYQSFSDLRQDGCYYVDKTPLIRQMIDKGRYYFLSRPRRFGKSLLVDTLQELFEGNESLFEGLDIHPHWDWSVKYPVIRLSFGGEVDSLELLEDTALSQLYSVELDFDLKIPPVKSASERLRHILMQLHQKTGQQAVVLVDEYDRPVLNVLEDTEKARANRNKLRNLYSILKDAQKHIRFVFVTGITMFSKASFSSGLNNLDNISLYPPLASICGYTDQDLDTVFAPELEGLDRNTIREWYNGYSWLGEDKLYNPHDILHLFKSREFSEHWFESGGPGYLYRMLEKNRVSPLQLENLVVEASSLKKFELGTFTPEALLFQSGYLTITKMEQRGSRMLYHLHYPNFAVQSSFSYGMAEHWTRRGQEIAEAGNVLVQALAENDYSAFQVKIKAMLSGIPHAWPDSGSLDHHESWFASLLYMSFRTTTVDLKAEEMTSHGRSDLVVLHENQVFVFEFKVLEGSENMEERTKEELDKAIEQIRAKKYADKYLDRGEPIHLIGMVFGEKARNLLDIRVERL